MKWWWQKWREADEAYSQRLVDSGYITAVELRDLDRLSGKAEDGRITEEELVRYWDLETKFAQARDYVDKGITPPDAMYYDSYWKGRGIDV